MWKLNLIEVIMFKFAPMSSSFVAQATSGVTAAFRTPRLDFNAIAAFVEKLKPGYQEKMDRQKIASLFQLNNEVRETSTNREYRVYDVRLGLALLIDANDNVQMVDWHTSAGAFKGHIADEWELVKSARP
jgi:hypothetical protein